MDSSFNEIVNILNKLLGTSYEPEYIDNPYCSCSYQNETQADITEAQKLLNFEPQYDLVKGIKDYLKIVQEDQN